MAKPAVAPKTSRLRLTEFQGCFEGEHTKMTMDKSLKRRSALMRPRSVLTRAERIERLKSGDRWAEGDSPLGLEKVRVFRLVVKKKKKKKEEEGDAAAEGGSETSSS